jgi:hypothetical protein
LTLITFFTFSYPKLRLKGFLREIVGADLTEMEGFEEKALLDIISVTGMDMSKWPSAQHFAGYPGLSPRREITGGKQTGHERSSTNNPATQPFRLAAQSLAGSNESLGVLYRRLSIGKGSKTAIKAVARKPAILFYTLIKMGQPYDRNKSVEQERKRKERETVRFKIMAKRLGYAIEKIA